QLDVLGERREVRRCARHVDRKSNDMLGDRCFSDDHRNSECNRRETDYPGDKPGTIHRLLSFQPRRAGVQIFFSEGVRAAFRSAAMRTECQSIERPNTAACRVRWIPRRRLCAAAARHSNTDVAIPTPPTMPQRPLADERNATPATNVKD